MSTASTVAATTRLEKAALDNGFDRELPGAGHWLCFASTHAPLQVWLAVDADERPLVALSRWDVDRVLTNGAPSLPIELPNGAAAVHSLPDLPLLHRFLRRAWQLARTLPDELLHTFESKTAVLPRSTEAERLVVQRVGQDIFRAGLMDYWESRCAVTGLAVPELLRASHIKPWADCASDAERLDVFNGLLLAPQLDAAFDRGFITVADEGTVLVAAVLSGADRTLLRLDGVLRVSAIVEGHRRYLRGTGSACSKGKGAVGCPAGKIEVLDDSRSALACGRARSRRALRGERVRIRLVPLQKNQKMAWSAHRH